MSAKTRHFSYKLKKTHFNSKISAREITTHFSAEKKPKEITRGMGDKLEVNQEDLNRENSKMRTQN